jgi:hypothetical protein
VESSDASCSIFSFSVTTRGIKLNWNRTITIKIATVL